MRFIYLFSGLILFLHCGEGDGGETKKKDTIKIGTIVPLSGDLSSFGDGMLKSLILATEDINKVGGILGKEVEIVKCDDGNSAEGAKNCFDRLVNQGIRFIVGTASSDALINGVCGGAENKSCPAVTSKKVLMVSPSATSPLISELNDGGYIWRTAPSDIFQGKVLAKLVFNSGIRKVSLIYRKDPYGEKLAEAFKKDFEEKGGTILGYVGYSTDEEKKEFSNEIKELYKSGDPEGIVIISFEADGVNILGDLRTYIGQSGKSKPFLFGVDGNKSKQISAIEFSRGMSGTAPKAPSDDPDYKKFSEVFERRFGSSPDVSIEAVYDAFFIIALGIEAAGAYDPEKVKDVLVDLTNSGEEVKPPASGVNWKEVIAKVKSGVDVDYKGVSGKLDFDEKGDVKGGVYEIWRIETNKGDNEDFKEIGSEKL